MTRQQRFLTISEAAKLLRVSEVSLRRWTNSGKLRCFRVGGRKERRFLLEDLLAFMPETRSREAPVESPAERSPRRKPEQRLDEERHVSLFFSDPDEQWKMIRLYLMDHLSVNEPVIYIYDEISPKHLLVLLQAEGLPVEILLARGLLRFISAEQAYVLGGCFEARRMLAFMESVIQGALEAGHKRVFITGEMSWSLQGTPGSEEMITYEDWLNPLIERYPEVTIVCQYNLKRFDGVAVLQALLTHPSVHLPTGRVPGFYGLLQAKE